MMGEITQKVIAGTGVFRYSDGSYHLGEARSPPIKQETQEYLGPVLRFLHRLERQVDRYYKKGAHPANYEDLHFLASQVREVITGEYENPAVLAFVEQLASEPGLLNPENGALIKCRWTPLDLARESADYIHDMVAALLSVHPRRLDHVSFVVDAIKECGREELTICTLNHDTILEQVLASHQIPYEDGFGQPIDYVRYFDPDLLTEDKGGVRLLKLHGSIGWYRLRPDDGHWTEDKVAIIEHPDWYHTRDPAGRLQMPMEPRPVILIGTFNKAIHYTDWFFSELFYQFHQRIRSINSLVICGYGFGDKGINSQITQWIPMSESNRIVVVHPNPDRMRVNARGAIRRGFDYLEEQGRLHSIAKKAERVTWEDINKLL